MSYINKYFDQVYVITYKGNEIRHQHIRKEFEKHNIKFKFIYGPKGQDLDISQMIKNNKIYNIKKYCNFLKTQQNVIAITLTHKNAYEDMIKNNYQKCLFCEDDVFFCKNFENKFKNFIDNLKDVNWSILQLGQFNDKNRIIKSNRIIKDDHIDVRINKNLNLNWCFYGGAFCYGVNNKAVKILYNNIFPIRKAIDGYLGDLSNFHSKKRGQYYIWVYAPFIPIAFDGSHSKEIGFESTSYI